MTLSLFPEPSRTSFVDLFGGGGEELRYYQAEAVDLILKALETENSALYVMATGLGKTKCFTEIAMRWTRGPVLIFSDRNDLVDQNRAAMEKALGGYVELEQGDWKASPNARFVIGSVDSFHEKRLLAMPKDRFSLIIVDECHDFLTKGRIRAIKHFMEAGAKVIGCTATPGGRANEKALGQVFDCVPVCMGIEDGIDEGFLVPIVGRSVTIEEVDLDKVSTSKKKGEADFNDGELDEEILKGIQGIVRKTLELEPDRHAICFFPGVHSAELAAEAFNAIEPRSAAFVCATTEKFARKRIMADFKAGKIKRLCNVDIAGKGFDAPLVSMVLLACPTMSNQKYTQRVGRGTRVLRGVIDHLQSKEYAAERRRLIAQSAKPNMVILDFCGVGQEASLRTVAPEDILGGNFEPAEIALAKEKRKEAGEGVQVDPRKALEAARRELAAIRAAKVKATIKDFDPFRIYELDETGRYAQRFGEKLATEGQLHVLRSKFKIEEPELKGLSKRAAEKLITACFDRIKKKLCTLKQLRLLKQFGITRTDINFDRAHAALDYIIGETGWGKRMPIDPIRLNELVYGRRDVGEEG